MSGSHLWQSTPDGSRMKLTKRIRKAVDTTFRLYLSQHRKSDGSLSCITSSVTSILIGYDDENTIIAGFPHDVPGYYDKDLVKDFGANVSGIARNYEKGLDRLRFSLRRN